MIEDEDLGSDLAPPDGEVTGRPKSLQGEPESEDAALDVRPGLRVVPPKDREQVALQLAASLTESVAKFLLEAERQVATRADRIHALTQEDLERQSASVQSLIAHFAGRLKQLEEDLSSQQARVAELQERLDRHAEALRSVHEEQARYVALGSRILELLRCIGAEVGVPPVAPSNTPGS